MSRFNSDLEFKDPGGFPFILLQPLSYDSDFLHTTIIVPTGFKTDLASIPQVLEILISRVGGYDEAAVLHDFLYQTGTTTRQQADAVLREAMAIRLLNPVPLWKQWAIYEGIRAGGWIQWNCYRNNT